MLTTLRNRFPHHDWQPVTSGFSGDEVWRLDGDPALYAKIGSGVAAEAERLQWLRDAGMPAPEVVDAGTQDDVSWLISAAVPGRSAAEPWPLEQRAGVVDALADIARALHALPIGDCPFDQRLDVTMPEAQRQGRKTEELAATRPDHEELVVCHGDLCVPNVLLDPDTLAVTGLIDVGRLGVADRYVDLAIATRSLSLEDLNPQYGKAYADRFLASYGESHIDIQRIAFYRLLDEFT